MGEMGQRLLLEHGSVYHDSNLLGTLNWRSCHQVPSAIGFEVTFPKTMLGVPVMMCVNAEEKASRRRKLSRFG